MRIAVPLVAFALVTCVCVGHAAETAIADLPFEILQEGNRGGHAVRASELTLARDEITFRAMWAEPKEPSRYYPGALPIVDFDHWMVVAFFASVSGACDPYRLTRVIAFPDKITLHISHKVPGKNCTCIAIALNPYIMAKIPWTEKPLNFEIESELQDCL